MKKVLILISTAILTTAALCPTRAEDDKQTSAEEAFREAYLLLSQADYARDNQHFSLSIDLYRRALDTYIELARKYPDWQTGVIRFRLSYCDNQLKALLKNVEDGRIKLQEPGSDTGTGWNQERTAAAADLSVDHAIRQSKELLTAGNLNDARNLLLETLKDYPDNITVRLLIGITQCESRKFDDAVFLLENLVEENPENADARVILGTAYFGLNRTDAAMAQMKQALELNPSHKEAHFNIARIMLASTPVNREDAMKHYRKAISLGITGDPELNEKLGGSIDGEPEDDE